MWILSPFPHVFSTLMFTNLLILHIPTAETISAFQTGQAVEIIALLERQVSEYLSGNEKKKLLKVQEAKFVFGKLPISVTQQDWVFSHLSSLHHQNLHITWGSFSYICWNYKNSVELCFVIFNCCVNWLFPLPSINDSASVRSYRTSAASHPVTQLLLCLANQAMSCALLSAQALWSSWTGGCQRYQGASTAVRQHIASFQQKVLLHPMSS